MNDKEQEYKMYHDYIESMYGKTYVSAMGKLCAPEEMKYDSNNFLKPDYYLTDQEKKAMMFALPYLAHMENEKNPANKR